ncbi:Fibronectin type III domain-containing protein 7 [Liparis tanakae]|uniref:Fibronectin type III domain-containing protein 7 n=1 Tax=Liparis tanakae TaxID=230148 RepID=A0A4Z2EKX9_9TELE|nr:Fibronectin type III domain-containing protein 7 [Liparis tanakae]
MAPRTCGQTFVHVSWKASRGALRYRAAAVDDVGNRLTCSSNETSCVLEGLVCSRVYSVGVSAMLGWSGSPNAASYAGRALGADGHNVTCDPGTELGCRLHGLHCGTTYTFTVSASDGDCRSPDSEPVVQSTAPCAVERVTNSLNCTTNTLTVSWAPGSTPLNHSVTALAAGAAALRCSTEASSCTLTPLRCGRSYNVTVNAISGTCEGRGSDTAIVHSVPCVPEGVRGAVECSTNTVMASWDAGGGEESYISRLEGAGGFSSSCPTANTSCLFPGLRCAQTFTLSVTATSTSSCDSAGSAEISTRTAPCDPTDVALALHCASGVATVTWGAAAGAKHYSVLAESAGHADHCRTNGTSCELSRLLCGERYAVSVLAGDGSCNSSVLGQTNVTTGGERHALGGGGAFVVSVLPPNHCC